MSSNKKIKRHTKATIVIHWFNALFWFFLLVTGLGLIENPSLQPLGQWYPDMVRSLFGGGANLLYAHWTVGAIWAGVWLLFILILITRLTMPFLKEIFTFKLPRDLHWLVKKNMQMLVGYKIMARLVKPIGWDGLIPDQSFYNAGQKAAAIPMVLGGLVLAVTGTIMAVSKYFLEPAHTALVQWSITIHFIAAGVTLAILLVHIYMAAISKDERPAFFSMFTGYVPEEYAEHHHKLWLDQVK